MDTRTSSDQPPLFKWRHFQAELIVLAVRWYLRYPLSYRQVEELVCERSLEVDHTTIYRWVQAYAPELDKRCRAHLRPTNDSWKVDETYIKIKGRWYYLYQAVDSTGQTLDFLLTARRDPPRSEKMTHGSTATFWRGRKELVHMVRYSDECEHGLRPTSTRSSRR